MVDLLNACMKDEMRRDPRIVVFGEDVADASREESLGKVKGKGGVFKVTRGLQKEFGGDARLQLAAGRGQHRRPRDRHGARAASSRWSRSSSSTTSGPPTCRSATSWRRCAGARNNAFAAPVVIRVTYGGYLQGGASTTRRPGASLFTALSRACAWCARRNALDANGLLRTAIRCDDPVLFLEHKHLYRQTYNKGAVSGPELHDPVRQGEGACGKGRTSRVVTYGALVQRALVAAQAGRRGARHLGRGHRPAHALALGLGDDRRLGEEDQPRDRGATRTRSRGATARRSPRGSPTTASPGSTRRSGGWRATDTFVGYAPALEDAILPQISTFVQAYEEIAAF